MLTLKECRELVDPKRQKYTDEQLQMKLDFLTQLHTIIMNDLKQKQDEKESSFDVKSVKR